MVLLRIPRWHRQHFTSRGSRKVLRVCRDGSGAIQGDGNAEAAAERVELSARAGLCSGSPGPRRAREELSCPFLHQQPPAAPPRSRGELTPLGEPLIGT